ncbi:putative adhesion G-protein coupled receptor G5-like [Sesbania bispinosa]|nr:putative adhesion G-protein coupled receptor G5-like [Sesbania bispinosa]
MLFSPSPLVVGFGIGAVVVVVAVGVADVIDVLEVGLVGSGNDFEVVVTVV